MQHDRYENDILKTLKNIATSLDGINKSLKDSKIRENTPAIKELETVVDQNKTLDEQGLPNCWTCKFYNVDFGICDLLMRANIDLAENTCCIEYEEK